MAAISILSHLSTPSHFEPAYPSGQTQADITEFHRDGEVLCLEPLSGQWVLATPVTRSQAYADLMRMRLKWLRNPDSDGIGGPAIPVTVSVAGRLASRGDAASFRNNGDPGDRVPPDLMLRCIRFVEAMHADRDRIFVFHGREHLLDWRSFDSMIGRYRVEGPPPTGTTRFIILADPTLVTPNIACRLKELDVKAHVTVSALPAVRSADGWRSRARDTFDQAMLGCERLRQNGMDPCMITTIMEPADLLKAFNLLRDHGFRQMLLRPPRWPASEGMPPDEMAAFETDDDFYARFAAAMMDVAGAILDHNRTQAGRIVEYGLGMRVCRIARGDWPYARLSSPCGAASGCTLGLDAQGNLFPCGAMFRFPEMAMGRLASTDTIGHLAGALADAPPFRCLRKRHVENIDRCVACHVQRFCGAECAADSYLKFGALNREGPRCLLEQTLFVELLWKVARDPRMVGWLCPDEYRTDLFSSCQWAAFA